MIEVVGDLYSYYSKTNKQIIAIPTNGIIDNKNKAVMGRGVALSAKMRFPWIDTVLGQMLISNGNHVHYLGSNLLSFPTKHDWRNSSDINLIKQSCYETMVLKQLYNWEYVMMVRPGCGNGGLQWEYVKPIIEPLLDDKIVIVTFEHLM